MTPEEFTIAYLNAIEKKHKDYFELAKLSIMDCLEIKGKSLISVHIIKQDLPCDIKNDIKLMFWIS